MTLSRTQARDFYDRFGLKQDSQSFYEDRALDNMLAHAALDQAEHIFEFGCGTGRLACRLFTDYLQNNASYYGVDISAIMVGIARQRLTDYAPRAEVIQSEGELHFDLPDASQDRFVSTYVLDLLADPDIEILLREAHRLLRPQGRLCLVSLSRGYSPVSSLVAGVWALIYRLHARLVGGCRPLALSTYIQHDQWDVLHHLQLSQFAIPSEVLILGKKK